MDRGNELGDEAVREYEAKTGKSVSKIGIVLSDDLSCAISPDGAIYEDNKIVDAVEIKCPKLTTFISWKLSGELPSEHFIQVQSQMWALELESMDFCFYHPDLGVEIIRVDKDIDFVNNLVKSIKTFTNKTKEDYKRITNV